MRRFLALLLCVLPLAAFGQSQNFPQYVIGAPPAVAVNPITDRLPIIQGTPPVTHKLSAPPGFTASGIVESLTQLQQLATSGFTGVYRLDYGTHGAGHVQNGAPPLPYLPQLGTCGANGLANDGGACVNTTIGDGNSWKAIFPNSLIDIRQFGAIPDNSSDAAAAIVATLAYSNSIGGCAYVPHISPGFKSSTPTTLSGSGTDCIRGVRLKSTTVEQAGGSPAYCDLHYTDTSGLRVVANNGFHVEDLALCGNATTSTVATHTDGLYLGASEGIIRGLWISGFAVCAHAENAAEVAPEIFCRDTLEFQYPNITNDYPYAGMLMTAGSGSTAAMRISGGKYEASGNEVDIRYTGDGATAWVQICAPFTGGSSTGTIGVQLTCSNAATAQSPLWAADGIQPWFGAGTTQPNGHLWYAPSIDGTGYKECGPDYTIWDVSATGGGGSGGTQLVCGQMTATLVEGNTTAVVSGITGNIGSDFSCPTVCNILAWSDHGLLSATKLTSVAGGATVTLSKAPYMSGTVTLRYTQIAVATTGGSYLRTCQANRTCGNRIEIRFTIAPPLNTQVNLVWQDPYGYAGFDIEGATDYIDVNPLHLGGYRVLCKHIGYAAGGVNCRPTYIEIARQGVEIGPATWGGEFHLHRIINDPITNWGYVDPVAGPVIGEYNNQKILRNGADNGGVTNATATLSPAGGTSIAFTAIGAAVGPPQNGPYTGYTLECHGLELTGAAAMRFQFGQGGGSSPTWKDANYHYDSASRTSGGATGSNDSTSDSGISLAGTIGSSISIDLVATTGAVAATGNHKQVSATVELDDGTTHTSWKTGGGYGGDTNAETAFRLLLDANAFAAKGSCALLGHY